MTRRAAHCRRWAGLADPDRRAQQLLDPRRSAGDPDERRPRHRLPGLQQHRPDPRGRPTTPAWPARWSTRRSRSAARSAPPCSTPWRRPPRRATSWPTAWRPAQAGVVHGFAVAFAVGAGLLLLGAIVSAVFISAGPSEVPAADGRAVRLRAIGRGPRSARTILRVRDGVRRRAGVGAFHGTADRTRCRSSPAASAFPGTRDGGPGGGAG